MTSTAEGYRITPLVARRPSLSRPDVWFFLLLYLLLSLLPLTTAGRGSDLLYRLTFGLTLFLHLLTSLASQWSIDVQRFLGYRSSLDPNAVTHVVVSPPPTAGVPEIVPVQRVPAELDPAAVPGAVQFETLVATYQKLVFTSKFIPGLTPTPHLSFEPRMYPTSLPLEHYSSAVGLTSASQAKAALRKYGVNDKEIPLPTFASCLLAQLVAPFFIFQCLCCALWCLDEYWYYSIFTLFMLIVFESTMAFQRIKSLQRLRQTLPPPTSFLAYRARQWTPVLSTELLVGDLISLTRPPPAAPPSRNSSNAASRRRRGAPPPPPAQQVPADLLLLRGHLVVNEAMLTGESVPQQKEPLDDSSDAGRDAADPKRRQETKARLDVEDGGTHVRHLVSAGTVVVDHRGPVVGGEPLLDGEYESASARSSPRPPPDGGCVCYVLRTGFGTSQGRLLRSMAFASKETSVNTGDTFAFIAGLLLFAILAAAVVVEEGLKDKERNRFRLLLHTIMIVTSVVPPELPMELSLAVTNSLKSLMQINIFCTEPFRVPMGGRITTCCFDKTGTLTSDEMILNSIIVSSSAPSTSSLSSSSPPSSPSSSSSSSSAAAAAAAAVELKSLDLSTVPSSLPLETARILAACHSLSVQSDGGIIGDPLEQTCLSSVKWILAASGDIVYPPLGSDARPVKVLHRYGFESRLKRMSVVVRDENPGNSSSSSFGGHELVSSPPPLMLLCKGAPETMKSLLVASSVPPDFDKVSMEHMSRGQRVLCLAHRMLDPSLTTIAGIKSLGREKLEADLVFAGFVTLDCPLKSDTSAVIKELISSQHDVVMITGDAVLTAAEVARKVGIVTSDCDNTYELVLKVPKQSDGVPDLSGTELVWKCMSDEGYPPTITHKPGDEKALIKMRKSGACLCVSGDVLLKLAAQDTTPSRSETLEERLSYKPAAAAPFFVPEKGSSKKPAAPSAVAATPAPPDAAATTEEDKKNVLLLPEVLEKLRYIVPHVSVFARHAPRQKEAVVAALNACGKFTLMCGDGTNDVGALKQAHVGISLISVPAIEKKKREASDQLKKIQREEKKQKKAADKKKSSGEDAPPDQDGGAPRTSASSSSSSSNLRRYLQEIKEADEELDYVALGDASVASPFTSRGTSIMCCKRVILQGRCTLVTMLQIYKILGVNCLVTAMNLSKQTIIGVKQGDTQLTTLSVIVALMFFMVSLAKPLATLSPKRPPASVLCLQALLSIALQFSVHLVAIWTTTQVALPFLDPDDPSHTPDGPFNPTALNTASFITYASITISTFMVNYRGRPYMESLSENKALLRSLQLCFFLLAVCATEVFPPLNEALGLSPMPSGVGIEGGNEAAVAPWVATLCQTFELKGTVCLICVLDALGVLAVEGVIRRVLQD